MSDPLYSLELNELASLIQRREVSPLELTAMMIARIEKLDPQYRAFACLTPDLAMEQAKLAESRLVKRQYLGPMHGVPIALKDLCYTRGIPTAAGMPLNSGFIPAYDGTATRRLRESGAILLGKLQLTEGAFTEHHPDIAVPVNPWDEHTWSGASSTGSGVALAAGLCFAATGSDTGGSIRFPCAANGVTGIKPTWGRVSVYGCFELAASLDHLGPMARSATDCAIMLQEIAGADDNDPRCSRVPVPNFLAGDCSQLRGVRVGIDRQFSSIDVDADTQKTVNDTCQVLESLGATIVPVEFPDYRETVADWGPVCAIEAAYAHRNTFPERREEYGPTLRGFLDSATGLSAADYQAMLMRRKAFSGQLERVLHSIDLLLIPAQSRASPTIKQMQAIGDDAEALSALIRFTAPIDMSGHPAITLPSGFTSRGTPLAIQLVGRYWSEECLVRAGRAYQQATHWHRNFAFQMKAPDELQSVLTI